MPISRTTRLRVLPILFSITFGLLLIACSNGTSSELPTPNPLQAIALTRIAQGTPANQVATDIASANGTAEPEETQATKVARADVTDTLAPPTVGGAATAKPKATKKPGVKKTATPEGFEPTATPPALPPKKPTTLNSPEYSVQAFMWYRPEIADRDMDQIKAMGFTWVKQQFAWRDIEGAAKGAFDWSHPDEIIYRANVKGLDVLARMDNAPDWAAPGCFDPSQSTMGPAKNMQDWTDFLKAFVTRYKGRIRAYQIWNEPNLAREWCKQPPNPAQYVALLKASYQTIKSIDPNALVISAGLTPTTADFDQAMPDMKFFGQMYDAMGNNSTGYFDLLGVHAAGYKADPEADPGTVAQDPSLTNNDPSPTDAKRIYSFRHVEDVRNLMVQRGDANKQIAILEFGWTSDSVNPAYAWFRVSEDEKADLIVRAFQYAKQHWTPWIGVMDLIYMANPDWTGTEEQYWWAITNPDGSPRPAYNALKAMAK